MSDELDRLNEEERELRLDVSRARRADAIMNDEMVVSALADIVEACQVMIRESKPEDVAEREDAYRLMRVHDMFKSAFEKHLGSGTIADHRIVEIEQRRRTLMDRIRGRI